MRPLIMTAAAPRSLIFRPAYPDEVSRANYVEGAATWRQPGSFQFLAVEEGTSGRIVAVIRCSRQAERDDFPALIDFRFCAGPGGEIAGQEDQFLAAFMGFIGRDFRGTLRHLPLLPETHPLAQSLAAAGFAPRYSEHHLEIPWQRAADRGAEMNALMRRVPSPLQTARIVPARDCQPEQVISLLAAAQLMGEAEIRAIWDSSDRRRFDRDASACLVWKGETIGTLICADAGKDLLVMAIAGREDIPGTRRRIIPWLTHHLFLTNAGRGYERVIFRANAQSAAQTRNLAHRAGGSTLQVLQRYVREIP